MVKKSSFSIYTGMSRIFKRRYKPYTYAFLPSKDPDSLVIDLKKSLLGQMSGSICTKNNKAFMFDSTVDLKGCSKAWDTYEECIRNDGFK